MITYVSPAWGRRPPGPKPSIPPGPKPEHKNSPGPASRPGPRASGRRGEDQHYGALFSLQSQPPPLAGFSGQPCKLWPAHDKCVVGLGVLGPALLFGNGEKPVGQFAGELAR